MAYNPYIPWNDEMVVVLLNLVVTEGVHIAKKSEITKKWNAVNDLFFEQNELLLYKSAYKKDDHRKLRDKYKSELKKIKADIDTGNQSGKSGELSQKYQLVQHILKEDTVEILYEIGIDLMIDIYCTRGWSFGAEKFKDAMEKMMMKPIVAHKMYRTLERWRVQCKPTPPSTETPLSSSSSSSVSASLSFN